MALTIEDGTIVTGADSWITRAEYIAYAASKGITIADDADADAELVQAAEFIGAHEPNLKGDKVARDQPLAYPRKNLVLEGFEWKADEIPRQVILCQMALALDIHAGIDLYNPSPNPNRATRREKVDVIEVEYFGKNGGIKMNRDSTATALLATLLKRSGLMSIPLVRA
jgi:hypothetical protein